MRTLEIIFFLAFFNYVLTSAGDRYPGAKGSRLSERGGKLKPEDQ